MLPGRDRRGEKGGYLSYTLADYGSAVTAWALQGEYTVMSNQSAIAPKGLELPVIQAAGGLVWRQAPYGSQVAVMHRRQTGVWCLPHGTLHTGETWQQAALRTIAEDIGCKARITGFAGSISYQVRGVPTVVLFWDMALVGESTFRASQEIDQVVWLSPRQALPLLKHAEERQLLAVACSAQRWAVWPRGIRRWNKRYQRLVTAFEVYRAELSHRIDWSQPANPPQTAWIAAAEALLQGVATALDQKHLDRGWQCLLAAQRMEMFALGKVETQVRADALRYEAEAKLRSWRKKAVLGILGPQSQPPQQIDPVCLRYATMLRDEDFHNQYFKMAYLSGQFQIVLGILLLAVVALVGLAEFRGGLVQTPQVTDMSLLVVALFGVMGGAFSGLLSLAKTATQLRIPEQIINSAITCMRPFLGAAGSLAVYTFLVSGIFKLGELTPFLLLAVSFAAGFSERLISRAVASVTKQAEAKEQA